MCADAAAGKVPPYPLRCPQHTTKDHDTQIYFRLLQVTRGPCSAQESGSDADADADAGDGLVVVGKLDFWDALAELRPSLSAPELERYRQLREGYEGGRAQS